VLQSIGSSTQGVRRDLAEALLLLHGLVQLLVRRGIISQQELQTMMDEIDLRDGELNGYLDPATSRTGQPNLSPKDFLHKLSQEHRQQGS
jgi:hypothetical protein